MSKSFRFSIHVLGLTLRSLTLLVTASHTAAYQATLLSLIPLSPPTLLFAGYAEPFFATLSFKGMLACERGNWLKAAVCFGFATVFRSNGVLLAGYLVWGVLLRPSLNNYLAGKSTQLSVCISSLL